MDRFFATRFELDLRDRDRLYGKKDAKTLQNQTSSTMGLNKFASFFQNHNTNKDLMLVNNVNNKKRISRSIIADDQAGIIGSNQSTCYSELDLYRSPGIRCKKFGIWGSFRVPKKFKGKVGRCDRLLLLVEV